MANSTNTTNTANDYNFVPNQIIVYPDDGEYLVHRFAEIVVAYKFVQKIGVEAIIELEFEGVKEGYDYMFIEMSRDEFLYTFKETQGVTYK